MPACATTSEVTSDQAEHRRTSLAPEAGTGKPCHRNRLLALLYAFGDAPRFEQRRRATPLSEGTSVRRCAPRAHCRISASILQLRVSRISIYCRET
jgi:hypothetical protein